MVECVLWMVVFVCKRYYFLALVLMNEGRVEGWAETPGEAYLLLSLITHHSDGLNHNCLRSRTVHPLSLSSLMSSN